jgi:hypothetical protein
VIGNYASVIGSNTKTVKEFPIVTLRQVEYYREKVENDIHWERHGGLRPESLKVGDDMFCNIILIMSWMCDINPGFALQEYSSFIFWLFAIQVLVTMLSLTMLRCTAL